MTTKFIGVKKFRDNFTTIWKEAKVKNVKYIVMYHGSPVLEVKPITIIGDDEGEYTEEFKAELEQSIKQAQNGEVYTSEEVAKMLGI